MTVVEGFMSNVFESRPSHGVLHGGLLSERGDGIVQAAAQENRSAKKVLSRFKSPIAFGYPVFVDPFEKDSDYVIAAHRKQRRQLARPLSSA